MNSPRSKHPLFIRLEDRKSILENTSTSSLSIESEKSPSIEQFISLFSKTPEKQLEEFLNLEFEHSNTFVKLLSSRSTPESLTLLCAFIDRLLDLDFNNVIKELVKYSTDLISACSKIIISHSGDHSKRQFLIRTILLIFGAIISEPSVIVSEESIGTFMRTIMTLLSKNINEAIIALEGLKRALKLETIRSDFINSAGIPLLNTLLVAAGKLSHTDSLYHILFCLWALSFSPEGTAQLSSPEFSPTIARLLATIQPEREELVRILILLVLQLIPSTSFVESAYDNDVLRLLRTLQVKHYVDQQITKLITEAAEKLHKSLKHLSLWEKYVREVKSGKLRNSLSHRSDLFWKANIEKFGEHNYAILLELRKLLDSEDEETVSVACHDLGEYVSRHPLGRVKLEDVGAKEVIMRLLTSKSQSIQSQALRTTQLLLLRSHE